MSRSIVSALALVLCLVAVLALGVGAAPAKKKQGPLYRVTFTGSAHVAWTQTVTLTPQTAPVPEFCSRGSGTETQRFAASVSISPHPGTSVLSYYGRNFPRLLFEGKFGSLQASASTALTGHFEPDPQLDPNPNPSDCALGIGPTAAACTFHDHGELEKGSVIDLSPRPRRQPHRPPRSPQPGLPLPSRNRGHLQCGPDRRPPPWRTAVALDEPSRRQDPLPSKRQGSHRIRQCHLPADRRRRRAERQRDGDRCVQGQAPALSCMSFSPPRRSKPGVGLEPTTPSLPWKCSTN